MIFEDLLAIVGQGFRVNIKLANISEILKAKF